MNTPRWDELLVNEHEMIERAMDIMRRELEKLPQGEVDQFAMKRALDFLLEFGDRIWTPSWKPCRLRSPL